MAKKNLTKNNKTAGTYLRLTPAFKKEIQLYALDHGTNLTKVIETAVREKLDREKV